MKKLHSLLIISFIIFLLTSCNNNIVPKGYTSQKTYSDATIEQIGHTIQYTIFKYDNTPNLSKNRFLETVKDEDKTLLEIFLTDYNLKLEEYDSISETHEFKENFNVNLNNISNEDYIYIDYRTNDTSYEYFVIYYFETSINELYFLQLIYK
jgi:hypothetical protein